jgi:hypothetical protein
MLQSARIARAALKFGDSMRNKSLMSAVALSFSLGAAFAHADGFTPLWEVYGTSGTVNDSFYTTYWNEAAGVLAGGLYVNHGVAAYIPCSPTVDVNGPNGETPLDPIVTADQNHGTNDANFNFPCAQPPGTVSLYRYWKGAPENNHAYVTNATQANALGAGYGYDRREGFIYSSAVAGTVPLYTLHSGAAGSEIDRRYTVSTIARQGLLNAGWHDDGVLGYVYTAVPTPTVNATGYTGVFNGYTVSPTGSTTVPILNVTPPTTQYNLNQANFASNTFTRPAGAVWQDISFIFYTGDMFTSGLNHWPIYLHYASTPDTRDLSFAGNYDGVALVIARTGASGQIGTCDTTPGVGQLYLELNSGREFQPGTGKNVSCDPRLQTPLQPRTYYSVDFRLNDSAQVKISLGQYFPSSNWSIPQNFYATGTPTFTESLASHYGCPLTYTTLSPSNAYCGNPFPWDGFPAGATGYDSHPIFDSAVSGTQPFVSGMQVNWLDANGNLVH